MPSRYEAVRSLIQLTYDYLKLDRPLSSAAYATLVDRQRCLQLDGSHWIDTIETILLEDVPGLAAVEASAEGESLNRFLDQVTAEVIATVDDLEGCDNSGRSPPPFLPSSLTNLILTLLGIAIAYGLLQLGQRWRTAIWPVPAPTPVKHPAAPAPTAPASIGGTEGDQTPDQPLGIDRSVFRQLQVNLAIARGLDWSTLAAAEQAALTETLVVALDTLPAQWVSQIGHYDQARAAQLMSPPVTCRQPAQTLYDQADLALYRLFPDLLGVNIADTGFDQVWYVLLAQQIALSC